MSDTAEQKLVQLAQTFREATERFSREVERKLELARALGQEEEVVKEHIKLEVMKAARKMFGDAYFVTARVRPWRE